MGVKAGTVEREIARIASRQHGIVSRAELLRAAISRKEIAGRIRVGLLIRVYRGVYRVGHQAPSLEARYMAAVKAAGDGAVLSGRAAAYLLGLIKGSPPPPEVTAPTGRCVNGLKLRRSRKMDRREATLFRGIPVTTVPRTLVDLAAVLPEDDLARAVHEAEVLYRMRPEQVEVVLARRPNTSGAGKLRRVLRGDVHVLLGKLEKGFFRRLEEVDFPLPKTNRPAGGRRVDCRWDDPPLTVELLSYTYHHSRCAWEQDHLREREARARGDEFRTYTWRDVFEEPDQMLRELRELLKNDGPD